MPSAEMLKKLLDEFEEKELHNREEINVIQEQIIELEKRIEQSKEKLNSLAGDRAKINVMINRYADNAMLARTSASAMRASQPAQTASPGLSSQSSKSSSSQPQGRTRRSRSAGSEASSQSSAQAPAAQTTQTGTQAASGPEPLFTNVKSNPRASQTRLKAITPQEAKDLAASSSSPFLPMPDPAPAASPQNPFNLSGASLPPGMTPSSSPSSSPSSAPASPASSLSSVQNGVQNGTESGPPSFADNIDWNTGTPIAANNPTQPQTPEPPLNVSDAEFELGKFDFGEPEADDDDEWETVGGEPDTTELPPGYQSGESANNPFARQANASQATHSNPSQNALPLNPGNSSSHGLAGAFGRNRESAPPVPSPSTASDADFGDYEEYESGSAATTEPAASAEPETQAAGVTNFSDPFRAEYQSNQAQTANPPAPADEDELAQAGGQEQEAESEGEAEDEDDDTVKSINDALRGLFR
ncbi:MAG TPA: hypothetical protein V6C72_13220 [Chroococcales cyanobacterium]